MTSCMYVCMYVCVCIYIYVMCMAWYFCCKLTFVRWYVFDLTKHTDTFFSSKDKSFNICIYIYIHISTKTIAISNTSISNHYICIYICIHISNHIKSLYLYLYQVANVRPRATTWRRSAWKPHAPYVRPWRPEIASQTWHRYIFIVYVYSVYV